MGWGAGAKPCSLSKLVVVACIFEVSKMLCISTSASPLLEEDWIVNAC